MKKLISKILTEWSYLVHDGMPNPKNPLHLIQLEETLNELSLPRKVSQKLLQNMRVMQEDWWSDLSPEEQSKYIKDHPKSQKAQNAKEKDKGDAEKGDKKPKEKEDKKDKTLKQDIDYNNPPEAITNDVPPSDEEFAAKKGITPHEYNPSEIEIGGQKVSLPLTEKTLGSIFKTPPHKFPKRYLKTLERIMNTQQTDADNPKITEFLNSPDKDEKVGAGRIAAQASELLMLMSTSLPDKEANVLFEILEKTSDATVGNDDTQILDKSWIGASRGMRNSALKNIKELLGDTVFRVKTPNGKSYIAEISNKKDLNIFLGSPSTGPTEIAMMDNGIKIEESRQAGKYTKNALKRSDEKLKNTTQDDLDILTNMNNMDDEELLAYISKLPDEMRQMMTSGDKTKGLKLNPLARKYLGMKDIPLPWDITNPEFKEKFKGLGLGKPGEAARINKAAIFMGYLQYADELNKDEESGKGMNFINNQVGIIGKEPFPKGSQRDVQNHFVENLHKPESTMSLGSFRLSPEVCNNIFGTTDYSKIEENLDIKKDKDGNYFLNYTVVVDGKEEAIEIAKIGARGKGIGYSSISMEMSMSPQFAHTTYCANMKSKNPPKEEELTKAEITQIAKLTRKYGECK